MNFAALFTYAVVGFAAAFVLRRVIRHVPRRLQRGGRRLPRRLTRHQGAEPRPFDWQHPRSILRRSFGPAYALAVSRHEQDGRVVRVPGYHIREREPSDLAIQILATRVDFQEAVVQAAEPFMQRRSE